MGSIAELRARSRLHVLPRDSAAERVPKQAWGEARLASAALLPSFLHGAIASRMRRTIWIGRQGEMKDGAAGPIGARPQPSAMRFDDRTADRQPQPQARRFGRVE